MKQVLIGGLLIDGTGREPIKNSVVVVDGSVISEVGIEGQVDVPQNSKVVDLHGRVVMPGLIDAEVHLIGAHHSDYLRRIIDPSPLAAIRSSIDAAELLKAGFTAVRDLASKTTISLKMAIEEGSLQGPRIMSAGRAISQTNGPADISNLPKDWLNANWFGRLADGVDECRRAVREEIRDGADLIKIFTTGGSMRKGDSPTRLVYTKAELEAMVFEAKRSNMKVASHSIGSAGVIQAVDVGVDTIEHGWFIDQEAANKIANSNAILVPTLSVVYVQSTETKFYAPHVVEAAKQRFDNAVESVKLAKSAGAKIACGSDFGGYPPVVHGSKNSLELELLTRAGFSPMESIVAATKTNSEALGLESQIGTVEKGKLADMIVLDENPLDNISIFQRADNIKLVVKNGAIVKDSLKVNNF